MMDLQPSSFHQSSANLSNNLAECAVCHQPIPKGRVHYGGVSCYSCRAFFRRNTQRDELPTCKNGSSCRVTYQDRKQCSACRYTKCLTIGMRPELVLDASGKQERFKKYLRKKNEERMKAEELDLGEATKPMPPLQPIPGVGYPLNVLLQQMQPFYPEPQTSFPSHVNAPQLPNLPLPFRFPISPGTKQVDSSRISSPPPASPRPVDLTSHPLNRSSVTSPSISSPVKYMPSYQSREEIEEFAKSAQLPALTKLHRSSVIANPGPPKKVYEEEAGSDVAERESSSERDEASSSKRRYWPLHPLLENSLPLHVEIKVEPEQEQEQEPVTEESLLHKYCHKKFQKAKTFSSDLRPPAENSEGENRKRRSVIVQAPSSKKPCSQDLRSFRISKPNPVEEVDQEQEQEVVRANQQQGEEDEEKEGSPVDLSRSSPTFQQGSWPSPRQQQSSEHLSDQEVPTA